MKFAREMEIYIATVTTSMWTVSVCVKQLTWIKWFTLYQMWLNMLSGVKQQVETITVPTSQQHIKYDHCLVSNVLYSHRGSRRQTGYYHQLRSSRIRFTKLLFLTFRNSETCLIRKNSDKLKRFKPRMRS